MSARAKVFIALLFALPLFTTVAAQAQSESGTGVGTGVGTGGTGVGVRTESPAFDNPDDAARYRRLISELRCLVCQNQTVADSNADLARDMRAAVAAKVRAGESDAAVAEFMTARYGDFVLYRPPFGPATWLLWLAPGALAIVGAGLIARLILRPRRAERVLDSENIAAKILGKENGGRE